MTSNLGPRSGYRREAPADWKTISFTFASLALTVAFGAGWLFGMLSAGLVLLKSVGERRRLNKSLRLAEAEVKTLRSMPIQDAD